MNDAKAKIEKLMAVATDGRGNEFEAEIALRQAEMLMRKHGIDVADLQERTGEKPVYTWATVLVPAGAPKPVKDAPSWFGYLITGIGKFTDTKVSYARSAEHGMCVQFQGDEIDVQYAVWLVKHLRDDCRQQSLMFTGPRYERESFRKAYAVRVQQRMAELAIERKEALRAHATSTGTALMVVENKVALRDAKFGEQRYARARSVSLHAAGAQAGRAAGDRASFNRSVGGASHFALT
jgi:hypothetical protein